MYYLYRKENKTHYRCSTIRGGVGGNEREEEEIKEKNEIVVLIATSLDISLCIFDIYHHVTGFRTDIRSATFNNKLRFFDITLYTYVCLP